MKNKKRKHKNKQTYSKKVYEKKNNTQSMGLNEKKDFKNVLKNSLASIIMSFAACFMIFLYAPIEIFFTNVEEFNFAFSDIISTMLPVFFGAFILFSGIFIILRRINIKVYNIVLIIYFIIFVSTYIQGTYMSGNLPPLDGRTINWAEYSDQRIHSIVLLVAVSAIMILIVKFKQWDIMYKMVKFLSLIMTAQFILVLIHVGTVSNGFSTERDLEITSDNLLDVSEDKNFFILLLDAVDSDSLSILMDKHPEYKEAFSDFTYYRNMSCAYPFTKLSLPFIFSGKWYENERNFEEYDTESYKESPFFSLLQDNSYDMTLYEIDAPLDDDIAKFKNIKAKDYEITSKSEMTLAQMKLIGFKYAPFDIKQFCTVTNSDFQDLKKTLDGTELFTNNNAAFYNKLKEKDLNIIDGNLFKYVHIEGAHVPYRYNENVDVIDNASYETNLEASMTITMEYLKKLKESGAYDNSVIIIMSDHGYGDGDVPEGRQNPIFFVKGFEETKDKMLISDAPVAHEDLQGAFAKLIDDEKSTDIFDWKEGDERNRRYLFYVFHSKENYKHITEYNITGHAADDSSLIPTGREFSQE